MQILDSSLLLAGIGLGSPGFCIVFVKIGKIASEMLVLLKIG